MAISQNIKTLNEMMREHGQGIDMSAKKAVWKLKGLDRRMGRYEGMPVQVNALIKSLKNNPLRFDPFTGKASFAEENPVINQITGQTLQQIQPVQPAPQVSPPIQPATQVKDVIGAYIPSDIQPPDQYREGDIRTSPATGKQETLTPEGTWEEVGVVPTPKTFEQRFPGYTQSPTGEITTISPTPAAPAIPPPPSATDVFKALGISEIPTAEEAGAEAVRRIMERPETEIETRERERKEAALRTTAEAEKERLRNLAAERGVTYSPKFFEQPQQAVEAGLISDITGLSNQQALSIMKAARQEAEDIIRTGETKRKEALGILEDQGLTIDLTTGQLVPTLAAQREERALRGEERAVSAAERAEEYLRIAQAREARLSEKEAEEYTRGEKIAAVFDDISRRAGQELSRIANTSADKFTDPQVYMRYRSETLKQTPTYVDDFDKRFSGLLNPLDADRLGISQIDIDPFEVAKRRVLRGQ